MLRNHGFRFVVALAVVLLLAGPAASVRAAGFGGPVTGGHDISSGVAGLWAWVKTALSVGAVAQAACDAGSYIDPDGRCRGSVAQAACDAGIYIDPNGRCRGAAAASPAGSAGAANGAAAGSDAGISIDPNGG